MYCTYVELDDNSLSLILSCDLTANFHISIMYFIILSPKYVGLVYYTTRDFKCLTCIFLFRRMVNKQCNHLNLCDEHFYDVILNSLLNIVIYCML